MNMKKIVVELSVEGSIIHTLVSKLRELQKQEKVFYVEPEERGRKYAGEALRGVSHHPILQPARGIVNTLKIIIGGSDHRADTAESLEVFLDEAVSYGNSIEQAYLKAVADVQRKLPSVPFIQPSKSHVLHARRQILPRHLHNQSCRLK